MFELPLNQKTVTAKLKRIDICDLMIACTSISAAMDAANEDSTKWTALHDKLGAILAEFDEKQGY